MNRPPFETFTKPTCRGCYAFNTACGHCEKCAWERQQISQSSKCGTYSFPRRSQIDRFTPEEKAIFDLVQRIESLGAHILLTDVVVKLGEARERLADWVDLELLSGSKPEQIPA